MSDRQVVVTLAGCAAFAVALFVYLMADALAHPCYRYASQQYYVPESTALQTVYGTPWIGSGIPFVHVEPAHYRTVSVCVDRTP